MSKINSASRRSYCVYRRGARLKQKKKYSTTAQGFGSVWIFALACIMLSGVGYLFSTNDVAIKGDKIYKIERDIKELSRENEQLVIQEAQLRSLESVETIVNEKGMEEITEPVYIEKETRVALD